MDFGIKRIIRKIIWQKITFLRAKTFQNGVRNLTSRRKYRVTQRSAPVTSRHWPSYFFYRSPGEK